MLVLDNKDILRLFYNTTSVHYYCSTYPLIAVAEGDDQSQQTRRKIRLKAVTIKYFFTQQLNNKAGSKVMWYIFQAKQYTQANYGTAPTIHGTFLDVDCNGWISSESFRNIDNSKRFQVLATGVIYIPQDSYAQQNLVKSGTIYAKVKRRMQVQEYTSTGGSSMVNPTIFLLCCL